MHSPAAIGFVDGFPCAFLADELGLNKGVEGIRKALYIAREAHIPAPARDSIVGVVAGSHVVHRTDL